MVKIGNMPNLRIENFGGSLKIAYVDNTELVRNKRNTYLSEDVVAQGTTMRVQSVVGFEQLSTSSGQVVLIGNIGEEKSEILTTSTTTGQGPSHFYKEVTFSSAMQFDHPQDTKATILDFNRVEFQYAATATGTKNTIQAYPVIIRPDDKETFIRDTTDPTARLASFSTAAYYFARFNDTTASRNSDWSDATYGTGFDDNMVGAIKKRALEELGEEVDEKVITNEFLNKVLWQARREYHNSPGKRPFRRKFNTDIGNALTGSFRIELPTDAERPFTAENIYGVRIGTEANMEYYDKKKWDEDYRGVARTYLVTAYTVGDQDLYVNDVRDFDDSGSVRVEDITIAYSARGISGGTLRISTNGEDSASVGSDVWQNASFGLPSKFTVFADPGGSAYIYFNRPFETAYANQNIYADYYRTLLGYNSDGDTLDEPKYDIYVHYLKSRIKQKKARGEFNLLTDDDYKLWLIQKKEALDAETLESDINLFPDISHLPIPS